MKILKIVSIILLIMILISVLYLKFIKQEPLIKIFGKAFLIVATGSMEPTILTEELIIIDEKEKYEKGDIITYIDEDGFLITHRIVELDTNSFVTKGDANNIKDNSCQIDRIQGKVIFHSKILGKFVLYWLKPLFIVYAVCILIIEIIKNQRREEKNET